MIKLGPEPQGMLLKPADIFSWLPGFSRRRWKKIRPTLRAVYVPCKEGDRSQPAERGQKPFYPKHEIKTKLVTPLLEN